MENNDYNIESVEFYYNGRADLFEKFLTAVFRDYLSSDPVAAVGEEESLRKSA